MLMFLIYMMLAGWGLCSIYKLLAPEMHWQMAFPVFRHRLNKDIIIQESFEQPQQESQAKYSHIVLDQTTDAEDVESRLDRLEVLLSEKNKEIISLNNSMIAEKTHRREFEKVQALMEEEIHTLREQLKLYRG